MKHWLRQYMPDHAAVDGNRWLAPFRNTLLHPRLWHLNRRSAAGGIAAGLFCGLIPGPFQMLGAAICAIAFRINLPLALVTTLYTNPLTIVPLYFVSYGLGQRILGVEGTFFAPAAFDPATLLDWLGRLGMPLVIGLLLLASLLAAAGYICVRLAWRAYLIRKLIQRKAAPCSNGRIY